MFGEKKKRYGLWYDHISDVVCMLLQTDELFWANDRHPDEPSKAGKQRRECR